MTSIHCVQRVHEKHSEFLKKMNELMDSKVHTYIMFICNSLLAAHIAPWLSRIGQVVVWCM